MIALTALFVGLLEWSYGAKISPLFAYEGYTHHPVSLGMHLVAWLLAVTPSLWMPIVLERPSQVIYWFLYVLVLIPGVIVPQYVLVAWEGDILALSGALYLSFVSLGAIHRLPLMRLPRVRVPRQVFWIGLACVATVLALPLILLFGLHLRLPALSDVYGVRADYKLAVAAAGGLVGYCVPWLGGVADPLFMAEGFARPNLALAGAGIVGQLFLFGITGEKAILFSTALVAATVLVIRFGHRRFGLWVMVGLVAVIAGSALADALTHTGFFSSLLVRRVIVTPSLLTGFYYDFFSHHPPVLLGHSVLSALSDYPYPLAPPRLIGSQYFYSQMNANANVWADAYANFHFGGMLVFTVILGVVLWAFDSAAREVDLRVTGALGAGFGLTLSNAALLTTLMTHGLAFAVVIFLFMPAGTAPERRTMHRFFARHLGAEHSSADAGQSDGVSGGDWP